jgi:methylthioribose-1-phosphate isomerase
MRVRGREMRAVWWEDGVVRFLDQRRLPHSLEIGAAHTVDEVARAIEDMAVRGAPAIGVLAAYGMALAATQAASFAAGARTAALVAAAARLLATRPTAVNLRAGIDAVRRAGPDPAVALSAARAHDAREVAAAQAIGEHGLELMRHGTRVLTHCNAGWLAVQDWGTALAPVYRAARAGLKPFVWVSETRPRLQGSRLTAWELAEEGVAYRIVADAASAHLIQRGDVDLVLVGADRIAANGDVANKIGTYAKALVARAHAIPFYVVAPLTTVDLSTPTGDEIPIEERPEDEVLFVDGVDEVGRTARVRVAPVGAGAANPAFDITPHDLVAGIVTEVGIVPATAAGIAEAFRRAESATRA